MGADLSCAVMELRPLSFNELFALHAVLDEECRPLGEHRAPHPMEGAAPTELRTCPYPGSRHENKHPMNLSALRQTTKHWDEVVVGLDALRTWCGAGEAPLTLAELWRFTAAASVLPAWLLYRERTVPSPLTSAAPLPVIDAGTAVLYKACLGLKFLIEQRGLEELLATGDLDGRRAADTLAEYSETSGWLVGRTEVCAATPKMINETMAVMLRGDKEAAGGKSRLVEAVGDPAQLQEFFRASWACYGTVFVYSAWSAWNARQNGVSEQELLAADPPLQNHLSPTLGMRRITTAFSALDEVHCRRLIAAYCAFTLQDPNGADAAGLAEDQAVLGAERDPALAEAYARRRVHQHEQRLNASLRAKAGMPAVVPEEGSLDLSAYRAPAPRSTGA